jgi:transposase
MQSGAESTGKYALSLELTDPGYDYSILSEFRRRMVKGSGEDMLLDVLLKKCSERKLLKAKGRQRTDSTHVLGWIRAINRLECVGETMRAALNTLATVAPEWLLKNSQAEWVERYSKRVESSRLPESKEKQEAYVNQVGLDGQLLLQAVYESNVPEWLSQIPVIDLMRQVWLQQYWVEAGKIYWRTEKEGIPPASQFISSPYDPDAHYARKYTNSWVGYKVHLTETCEEDLPNLITNVATTAGPIADGDSTEPIHESLKKKDLLPATHIVDTSYLDARLLVKSQKDFGVNLLGPTRPDYKWQAKAQQGFAAEHFQVDWHKQQVTCPEKSVPVGRPTPTLMARRWSRSNSLEKDCLVVEAGPNAPLLPDEPLPCVNKNITWLYWLPGAEKTPSNTRPSMPGEPA